MERPVISTYIDPISFMADMLAYRKLHDRHFSVLRVTKNLRRVSPTLVTLLLKRQRQITVDRADELSKLLNLSPYERQYFRDWIARLNGDGPKSEWTTDSSDDAADKGRSRRRPVSTHILNDWINVYVKDAFQLRRVKENASSIYSILAGIASQKRVDKAIQFLLRAGYLRRNERGQIVEDTPLHVVDPKISSSKIRQFHKAALKTAMRSIDLYAPSHRYANALILPLDDKGYQELTDLIDEMSEKLQKFAERAKDGDRLYQVLINLSPTGGAHE